MPTGIALAAAGTALTAVNTVLAVDDRAAIVAIALLDAARASRAAARTARAFDHSASRAFSTREARAAARATLANVGMVDYQNQLWREIRGDAAALAEGLDLSTRRLWSGAPPKAFDTADTAMRAIWQRDSRHWSFWTRWWNGVLRGEPLDWDLQFAVATEIPNEIWEKGPGSVAEAIAALQTRIAQEKTKVAERVEINPETGKLRLVPESALPEDVGLYVRRKIARALVPFEGQKVNQYTGLSPVFAILRATLTDAGDMPIELFDACASASRLTVGYGQRGDCPTADQDPLIADFLHRIREAGADILAHDPDTRDMLAKRNAIEGNNALVDEAPAIIEVAEAVASQSEGRLAETLPADAVTATNPDADPEERKEASHRIAGRLLKIAKIGAAITAGGGAAIVGTKEVLEALPVITASPYYQAALEAILRWLRL